MKIRMNRNSHKESIEIINDEVTEIGIKGVDVQTGNKIFIPFTSIDYVIDKENSKQD